MAEYEISVIIPVYNSADYLERCLDSVAAQSFHDMEIILVENGSTDASPGICDAYAGKDARIKVIHSENNGISAARNTGLDAASGRYITFVDSDDYIETDYCSALKKLLEDNNAGMACGAIRDVFRENEVSKKDTGSSVRMTPQEALSEMLKGQKINGSLTCKLYRRELFEGKRFPVGLTYEDAYLLPELILDAGSIAVTDKTYYTYWHRAGSITTSEFSEKALDAVTAYEHVLEVVRKRCPACVPEAEFRLYWAHFVVLDRMLASERYRELADYKRIVRYLKSHTKEIVSCPFFEKTRRTAAVTLKAGVPFYKVLFKMHSRRTEANE